MIIEHGKMQGVRDVEVGSVLLKQPMQFASKLTMAGIGGQKTGTNPPGLFFKRPVRFLVVEFGITGLQQKRPGATALSVKSSNRYCASCASVRPDLLFLYDSGGYKRSNVIKR